MGVINTELQVPARRPESTSATRAVALATLATGIGYLVTLAQQVLYARALGVNAQTDALATALAWGVGTSGPLGTALASVGLPAYVKARTSGDLALARQTMRATSGLGLMGALALATVTFAGADMLGGILAPGLGGDDRRHVVSLLRLTSPLAVLWTLVWLLSAQANARERYVTAAASFVIPPLPVIAVFVLAPGTKVEIVAAAYILGAALQCVFLAITSGASDELWPSIRSSVTVVLLRRLAPVGVAFALMSVAGLVLRALASNSGPGGVAVADYASRLVIAGEQVLLSGLLAVVFTRWSGVADDASASVPLGAPGHAWSVEGAVLRMLGVVVGIAFALPILAAPIVAIIFQGGRFGAADTADVAGFLAWMSAGVAGQMLVLLAVRALLASQRVIILVAVGALAVISLWGIGLGASQLMGLDGVALGFSAAWIAAAALSLAALRLRARSFVAELGRALAMGAASALIAATVAQLVPDVAVLRLTVILGIFVVSAVGLGHVLHVVAVEDVIQRLQLGLAGVRAKGTVSPTGTRPR